MSDLKISDFQQRAESDVRTLLEKYGRRVEAREVKTAEEGPFARTPETAVRVLSKSIEVWLYSDGATFIAGSEQARFDRPDFESDEKLREEFVEKLEASLKKL